MKIIDLLNKIANEEEVPKKIKYKNKILYLEDEAEDYEPTFNYYDKDGENALFEGWIGQYLNDEVEILEEENKELKKIEKLNNVENSQNIVEFADKQQLNNHILKNKINEIIDYLKSKGDE